MAPVIAFFPEASFGAALNCVGIAQELKKRGAQPVFITHGGFSGVYSDYGFEEHYVPTPADLTKEESETYWQDFLGRHLPHFNLPPDQQLTTYVAPVWSAIVQTARDVSAGLAEILSQLKPDLIVLDNVIMFPAIAQSGCPWVRVISCAETELRDAAVPPYLSGLSHSENQSCAAFDAAYLDAISDIHADYNALRETHGLTRLPLGTFLEPSPTLNLLLSPSIVRYDRTVPLDTATYDYLDGCVRRESPYNVPHFPANIGPLVYISFGSLGATDTAFFERLIATIATLPARFLVNVGALIEHYANVPDNVHLQDWFPQPSVVAQCDLFIHHGGNNSFCEALYFGVPSLVIPYCWDGHDNAQRAIETSVGDRLNRWAWTEDQLQEKIMALLADDAMKTRLRSNAVTMQKHPGVCHAATRILQALPPSD